MLRKLTERMHNEEKGFTLIELLVVMLIIGILAAIALPVFLGQQKKGQDASAKSDARNLVSHVESCYAETQEYDQCNTTAALNPSGLQVAAAGTEPAEEEVGVTAATDDTFVIQGKSKSDNLFAIVKTSDGTVTRYCGTPYAAAGTYAAGGGEGGCPDNERW